MPQIIDDIKVNKNVVGIGSHVTVKEDGYPDETYFMVGPKEADPQMAASRTSRRLVKRCLAIKRGM